MGDVMRLRAKQNKNEITVPAVAKIPPSLKKAIETIADEERRSFSNTVRILLEDSPRVKRELGPEAA
jgi:hypothetical protein